MFTCKTCGKSLADKNALRSVSSHLRPRCRRPFLMNGTDLPIFILHSTKRLNTRVSDIVISVIRNSLVRRLYARTKLPSTHSGVSYVASHLLHGKRFEVIEWPNIRHQCRTHPNLSTNATNAMSHCALLNDWHNTNKRRITKSNVTTALASSKISQPGMPTKPQNILSVAIIAVVNSLLMSCGISTNSPNIPFTTET